MRKNTRKIITAGLIIALGVIIPQAFHFTGIQNAGKIFLPMYLPVILGGMLLGPFYGLAVGAVTPVLSFVITGGTMPPMPLLIFMIIELMAYAFFSGIFIKKFNVILTLLMTMLVSETINAAVMLAAANLFNISAPFLKMQAVLATFVMGIPGMICQLVLIPVIMYALKRGGFNFERT